MIHAFRLGPITAGGSPTFAYVALEEGGVPRIHMAPGDGAGLQALRGADPAPLACEPSLAEAGRKLGMESAPLPAGVLRQRAAIAFELACGVEHGASKPEAIAAFLQASAAFWGARTWEVVGPADLLRATFSVGRNEHAAEVSVLGGEGGAPGMAVCDEPAALQRLEEAAGPERAGELRRLAGLVVEMEASPAWAAAAIGEAFTLTRVPTVVRTRGGRVASVSTQELVMGAALLEGVAACAGAAAEEEAEVRVEAAGLAVDVRLKPSALRPAAAPAASSADLTPVRPGPEGPPAEAPVAPPAAAAVEQPEPESPAEPEAREGWLARIGRALRGRRKEAEAPPPPEAAPEAPAPEAPAPEPGAAAKPAEEPEVEAPAAAAPAPEHPFAPFARALRVELPAEPPGVPPGEEAGDDALAARVAERAAAPGSELASFPAAALQILELVRDPKSDATRIAGFISRDPALSAGVISVANSAAFRGVSEVESVRDAVARLGLEEVGRVASAVSARAVLDPGKEGGAFRHLFTRAVAVSWAASAAAMRQRGARSDHVYLGGLLHDVGRALGARALAQLTAGGSAELTGTARAERVLDRVHARIGEAALQRWGLPQYLRDVCAHHHDEVVPPDQVDLHLVRLVSALALLREPALAARAAREILQSAGALRLGVPGVRALAADLRDAEQRAAALAR